MEKKKKVRLSAQQGLLGMGGICLAFLIAAVPSRHFDLLATPASRDQARVTSIYQLDGALTRYFQKNGHYPPHVSEVRFGGWETSLDGSFLGQLVEEGYLSRTLFDPINNDSFHFRYFVYPTGSWGGNEDPFYVLVATAFETPHDFLAGRGSYRRGQRIWSDEFAFALGSH
jgi:hypothetical protein